MKKKLLQEVIDSLIKEELKRQHKKYLKEFVGPEIQNAINILSRVPINSAPASSASRFLASQILQNPAIIDNPAALSRITTQLPPQVLRSANFPWLRNALDSAYQTELGDTVGARLATANNAYASVAPSSSTGALAAPSEAAILAADAEGAAGAASAAETAALGASAEGAAAATGAAETAALTAGAGEAAAAGTGAAGATGAGLGLSSVLPAAAAGTAGYVGGRIANAGIGAGLRAAGADVSQGAENASGWGDLSLGSWLSGLAGNGIQEPRTTQRGMPTPTGTQMPTPTDMSQVGNNINQINSAIQEFRRDFERQTAEIRSQMQSARSSNVVNTSSTPKSSTSTTGTK